MPRRRPPSDPPHRGPHHAPHRQPDGGHARPLGPRSARHQADLAAAIAPFVVDPDDRTFVARCIASEGPEHHRLASVALVRLAAKALEVAGGAPDGTPPPGRWVRFRLPPHLERDEDEDAAYPIMLPDRAIARLAEEGSREAAAYADALVDGPSHHALANVALVCLLDALIVRLERGEAR